MAPRRVSKVPKAIEPLPIEPIEQDMDNLMRDEATRRACAAYERCNDINVRSWDSLPIEYRERMIARFMPKRIEVK